MGWIHLIAQATTSPTVEAVGWNAVLTGGPVAVLMAIGIIYLVLEKRARDKRDNEREDREIERIKQDIATRSENTAALIEVRRCIEQSDKLREETRTTLELVREEMKG